ncbi:MAG: hypothetical protein ACOC33_04170, partial [bacterium]
NKLIMNKLKKIKTNETISEMFFRMKEECYLPVAMLRYVEKLYKQVKKNIEIPEDRIYLKLPDGSKLIEYPSLNTQNVLFNEPEKYIPILEKITNNDNFLCWCHYKDFDKYWDENNFKVDMTPFLSWVDVDMNLEPIRR